VIEFDIVIPTVGRPSLASLLRTLDESEGPVPRSIILVDDRRNATTPLPVGPAGALSGRVKVVKGTASGPAAARNLGWRAGTAAWVAFLDDDVRVTATWLTDLQRDLEHLAPNIAATQGRISVPLPKDRRPTDWERNVAGLERALWATADMAYRRSVLERVDGFDERFPRAYREDADLALRVKNAGFDIVIGERSIVHPVRPADRWVSVRLQKGNADDALMNRLHGAGWRDRASVPQGRFPHHTVTTAALVGAAIARLLGFRRLSIMLAGVWAGETGHFAWARLRPGPKQVDEVATMAATSVAIPPVAVYHRLKGEVRVRRTKVSS
jgi:glycosyltransferase involved in cell wall biosynthesis